MSDPRNQAETDGRPTLLIVDDDPGNLRLIGSILEDVYQLRVATTAETALRIAREQMPELILMDVVLPGISGLDACRKLAADPVTSDIPVIFITGGTTESDELACWDAGGVDYVSKPIQPVTLVRRIAVHMKLKQQTDRLRRMAGTDALTGLANRRTFDTHLASEWRRCRRLGMPLSVALVDADWFKGYNDRYGHDAGDRALKLLASTMKSVCTRASDIVARIGGEEFGILMPNTSQDGALVLVQRVRDGIADIRETHAGSPFGCLTVSAGVATVVPDATRDTTWLMRTADKRLYRAKDAGRNQACDTDDPA